MKCAECDDKKCNQGKDCTGLGQSPPMQYRDAETLEMTRVAATLEGRNYMKLNRLQELIRFAEGMGYGHLGIAFCIGLGEEARLLAGLLERRFKVSSVCCKVCGIAKEKLGLDKIEPERFEAMCNPAGQAEVLNQAGTNLNVALGLCVGHDIGFGRNSRAPVTTLIVKDRLLAHNPVGALYSRYWRNRIAKELEDGAK